MDQNVIRTLAVLTGLAALLGVVGRLVGGTGGAAIGFVLGLAFVGVSYWRSNRVSVAGRLWRGARRAAVATAGTALLALGAALFLFPGPGLLLLLAGLAVLATQFAWAERRLDQARAAAASTRRALPSRRPYLEQTHDHP